LEEGERAVMYVGNEFNIPYSIFHIPYSIFHIPFLEEGERAVMFVGES